MKPNHKPLSTKMPPDPSHDHKVIEDWIADAKPSLKPVVSELHKLIHGNLDDPRYAIKWGKAYFGTPKHGWCIELVAYDVSVNVVFLNGETLTNPPGQGDETRYVKVRSVDEVKDSKLHGWIRESCKKDGWEW